MNLKAIKYPLNNKQHGRYCFAAFVHKILSLTVNMDSLEEKRMSGYSCQVVKDVHACKQKAEIMDKKIESLAYQHGCYYRHCMDLASRLCLFMASTIWVRRLQ